MDSVTLKQLYDKACKGKYGCEYFKMDLHIHTPSSKCYKKTYTSNEEEYIKILDEAFENGIGIIAITDHNTVKGYYEMMDYIMADKKKYSKFLLKKLSELTGVSDIKEGDIEYQSEVED